MQTNYGDRKYTSSCLGMEAGMGRNGGLVTEGHREFWRMMAKFSYLDCGDDFMSVYIYQNLPIYLNMCSLLSIISQ